MLHFERPSGDGSVLPVIVASLSIALARKRGRGVRGSTILVGSAVTYRTN